MAPPVSLLLPVYNEEAHIESAITSLRVQDYPAIVEILVAEGASTDRTRTILEGMEQGRPPLVIVDNPDRNQAPGLNRLIRRATGEIAVRVDSHSTYAPDYVTRCVEALVRTEADMVGGPMIPMGETPREEAIAAAMSSPVGVGPSRYRRPGAAGETDTVYLGAYRLATIRAAGGYRRFPSGVAEDTDLAYRIRRSGGRVVLDPGIRSSYRPRSSYRALWRQFWRYGRGKAEMLFANGRFPSWRPLAPLLLVLAIAMSALSGVLTGVWWPPAAVCGAWLLAAFAGAARSGRILGTVWATLIMHASFGLGLAHGLLAGRGFLADLPPVGGLDPGGDPPAHHLDRQPQHREADEQRIPGDPPQRDTIA